MEIVYTGGHAQIEENDTGEVFVRDVPRTVDPELGKRLLEQEDFKEAKAQPAPPKIAPPVPPSTEKKENE